MTHDEKLLWMTKWCRDNGLELNLAGECGFGRECVGVLAGGLYPSYYWDDDETYKRLDNNGMVWAPNDAYHKCDVVAVLGRGEHAEAQLYEWLVWFDANKFKVEEGDVPIDPGLGAAISIALGKHRFARMVRAKGAGMTVEDFTANVQAALEDQDNYFPSQAKLESIVTEAGTIVVRYKEGQVFRLTATAVQP